MNPESPFSTPGSAGPEKPVMDDGTGWVRLLLNVLMIPVGLLVLVPLAIVVALWFYLAACKEGLRLALGALFGWRGEPEATRVLPAPHLKPQGESASPGGHKPQGSPTRPGA